MTSRGVILAKLMLIGYLASGAAAATALDVQIGWSGAYRMGRWTPLYITASDPKPRTTVIELYIPHSQRMAMNIRQMVTIGPTPATFVLYAPLRANMEDISVTLRDAATGRRLESWLASEAAGTSGTGFGPYYGDLATQLIVISGRSGPQPLLQRQFTSRDLTARSIDPLRLPAVALGYDSLDLLVLNQPDLNRISHEQQDAIVDWVRSGGSLLCWMSEDALPPSSPIVDALPAVVGDNVALRLSPPAVRDAGLPPRFGNLKGRQLHPRAGAQRLPLFNGEIDAWRARTGLGNVILLPIDPSTFLFQDERQAHAFWRPLIDSAVTIDDSSATPAYGGWNTPDFQRRTMGASQTMDLIGNIPGAGRFGFSYVSIAMIGMMLVVGPIDWIVLKILGRQPWTWITTSGWIALVTIGAVYLGHVFKSGDLHFRTLRLIDQADGLTVATIDAAAVYSPRTADYDLNTDPESWWEPLAADFYWSRSGTTTDMAFHQDYRGNRPQSLRINVWNVRFLVGQTIAPAPPVLEASLHFAKRDGRNRLVGTLTNRGTLPLTNIILRVCNGACPVQAPPLAPGATLNVDHPFTDNDDAFRFGTNPYYYPAQMQDVYSRGMPRQYVSQAWNLPSDRAQRINQLLSMHDDLVCIYADASDPSAVESLNPEPNAQHHWQMIRALVPLQKGVTE